MGSGDLEVLATPAVVAFAENACKELAEQFLEEGQTTVGTEIELSHLKASKIGGNIQVKVELIERTSRKLNYKFDVFENERCLARGNHQRVIVDIKRFMSKIND